MRERKRANEQSSPPPSGREVLQAVRERFEKVGRSFLKDPLNTGLIIASLFLVFTFFNLLGQIQPSSPAKRWR